MVLGLLLMLAQQQPATPAIPKSGIAKVEISPATSEVQVGQAVQLQARALDSAGAVIPGVRITWNSEGEGTVDSTGLVKGAYMGVLNVSAMAAVPGKTGRVVERLKLHVVPQPASRIAVQPMPTKVLVGTRLSLTGAAYSPQNDLRRDAIAFASSNPRVATITPDGRLSAIAAGQTTITAKAGGATQAIPIQVMANSISRLSLDPSSPTVLTGDVVRFKVQASDANGRAVTGFPVRWGVAGSGGVAQIDPEGGFVAETPGVYTITASLGSSSTDAVVKVEPRRVTRGVEVTGRVAIPFRSAEVWAHPAGKCVYLSTLSDRVYSIDVSTAGQPRIVDSMMSNSRIVNDVMTTEDGKYGVFSREGASDRKNGIVIFDATDGCHPKPISAFTETVSGGVHSSYVSQG
ncbi:MAG: Ig-like domain-containing protein, partial [Gemmatimonadota bacterium]